MTAARPQPPAGLPGVWPRLLTWLLPGLFLLFTAVLVVRALEDQASGPLVVGEVVQVEEQSFRTKTPGGAEGLVTLYRPYFRYSLPDGTTQEGRPDQASPDWNYPLGTSLQIRHDPDRRGVIFMPGGNKWYPALGMALVALVVSGAAYWFRSRMRPAERGVD